MKVGDKEYSELLAEEEKKNLFTESKTGSKAEFYGLPLSRMTP
jgi:hypothetical protein